MSFAMCVGSKIEECEIEPNEQIDLTIEDQKFLSARMHAKGGAECKAVTMRHGIVSDHMQIRQPAGDLRRQYWRWNIISHAEIRIEAYVRIAQSDLDSDTPIDRWHTHS